MPSIRIGEGSAPSTPSSGYAEVFITSDGHLKKINDSGATVDYDTALQPGSAAGGGLSGTYPNPTVVATDEATANSVVRRDADAGFDMGALVSTMTNADSPTIWESIKLSRTGGSNSAGTNGRASMISFQDANNATYVAGISGYRRDPNNDFQGGLKFYTNSSQSAAHTDLVQAMQIDHAGNVGIGTTPGAQLHTTGSVRFANFGAGAATFDSDGNISSASDENLKNILSNFNAGLAELEGIEPILYKWKPESGMETQGIYAGFSAQNVQQNIPEAVGSRNYEKVIGQRVIGQRPNEYKENGIEDIVEDITEEAVLLSLQDRALIAALVNAVKELSQRVSELEAERS